MAKKQAEMLKSINVRKSYHGIVSTHTHTQIQSNISWGFPFYRTDDGSTSIVPMSSAMRATVLTLVVAMVF